MSRIFEALQHDEKKRIRRRRISRSRRNLPRGNVDRIRPVDTADPHHCVEFAARVRREGLVDFLYGLVGMYPWQCGRCRRGFHRFER